MAHGGDGSGDIKTGIINFTAGSLGITIFSKQK